MARPSLRPRPMLPLCPQCNSACCSLSSSGFILTASAASLSSFSQDTLASISDKKKCRITAREFRIGCLCAAYVALPQRSVPLSLGRLEAAASHRILVSCALRGSLDGVPTGPFRCAAAFLARGPCEALPLHLLPMRSFDPAFIAHAKL